MSDSSPLNDSITPEKRLDNPCATTDVGQLHKRLTLNAASNLLCYFVTIVVAFFLTPFVVKTLGDSYFGLWTILLSFVGYTTILELGAQSGVVKLAAQYRASGNMGQINRLLSTAFLFFTLMGTLAAIVFVVVLTLFSETLIRNMPSIGHQGLLFAVIGVDVVLAFLMYVFTGILYGWQKYHAKNVISIATLITYAALVVLFLKPGALLTLVAAKTVTDFLTLVITVLLCRKVVPGLKLDPRLVTVRSSLELFSFSGKLFISATTTRLADNGYPIIVGYCLSAAAVTFFAIPTRLIGYARQIYSVLTMGFMPTFSDLHSKKELQLLRSIYIRYSRYILLVVIPILALIFVYGPAFIALWIGPTYAERGQTTLYLLTGAALVQGSQPLLGRLLIGVGKVNFVVLVSVVTSIVSLFLSIILVQKLGIAGVALSILVGTVITCVMTLAYTCHYFQLHVLSLIRQMQLRPLMAGVLLFGVASGLSLVLGQESYWQLALGAACATSVYAIVVYRLGIEEEEGKWLVEKLTTLVPRINAMNKGKLHND